MSNLTRIFAFLLVLSCVLHVPVGQLSAGGRDAGPADLSTEKPGTRAAVRLVGERIGVEVDIETGRMHFFETRPEGSGHLLFFDDPPPSYITLYTNGDAFIFGDDTGKFVTRPVPEDGGIESLWENELLRVGNRIELVRRAGTGDEDGVLITCTVENRYGYAVDVGLEALFDTCLGEKKTAHFELPGGLPVEYETVFEKDNIPEYWLSFDEEQGAACLRGVMKSGLVTPPDKLIFANYRALSEARFGYRVNRKKRFDLLPYSRNDSAAALLFEPVSVEPGGMRTFRMLFGLCGPGEYVLGGEADKSSFPEPTPAEEPVPPPRIGKEVDLDRLNGMLLEIHVSRESVERINAYIKRLNGFLGEGSSELEKGALTAEELDALHRALSALGR